jgi:hypothetical protein
LCPNCNAIGALLSELYVPEHNAQTDSYIFIYIDEMLRRLV